jgi:ArsR family transcriptional regulator
MNEYQANSVVFKVLSDPIRLHILDMLSCGELCACDILKNLSISQSTLSHHMKSLIESKLVTSRRNATWIFYSINQENVQKLQQYMTYLTNPKAECTCNTEAGECSCSA